MAVKILNSLKRNKKQVYWVGKSFTTEDTEVTEVFGVSADDMKFFVIIISTDGTP